MAKKHAHSYPQRTTKKFVESLVLITEENRKEILKIGTKVYIIGKTISGFELRGLVAIPPRRLAGWWITYNDVHFPEMTFKNYHKEEEDEEDYLLFWKRRVMEWVEQKCAYTKIGEVKCQYKHST